MAHKTLINGTAYEITGGKTLIEGTGYSIKKGRTLIEGTGYDISFSVPISDLPVGSSVYLNENGLPVEYLIVNHGIPSDSNYYDTSCNGTWLLRKDVYENRQWHSSRTNNYANSDIHAYLNSTFLGLFDADMQSVIKQVSLPYLDSSTGSAYASDVLSTKIFLLGCYELGWSVTTTGSGKYFPVDGGHLEYFIDAVENPSKRIAYLDGAVNRWWTRSPYINGPDGYYLWDVYTQGMGAGYDCRELSGVRPALVLPFDTVVSSGGLITV